MKPLRYSVMILALAMPVLAQEWYPKHNITLGIGGAMPGQDLTGAFRDRPILSVGYGYRFNRYLQGDFGFDTVFGAAGIRDFVSTDFGFLRIKDYQYFLPFGGRAILPLLHGKVLISGGGGGAWMKYSEHLKQPSDYYRFECPSCATRSGWGWYSLAAANVFIDRAQHIRLGVTSKMYRGHTDGDPLAAVPGVRTRDSWLNVVGDVGFSF